MVAERWWLIDWMMIGRLVEWGVSWLAGWLVGFMGDGLVEGWCVEFSWTLMLHWLLLLLLELDVVVGVSCCSWRCCYNEYYFCCWYSWDCCYSKGCCCCCCCYCYCYCCCCFCCCCCCCYCILLLHFAVSNNVLMKSEPRKRNFCMKKKNMNALIWRHFKKEMNKKQNKKIIKRMLKLKEFEQQK